MDIEQLIRELKQSGLYAECTCGEEFKLSEAFLFDGTKTFPSKAIEIQKTLNEALEKRLEDLKKREKLATKKAEITTKSVNVGKNLEKVLPTMRDFKWELPDSRFLGDPIDLITFNGLSAGKVNSINFIEVKSGNARLNEHQKSIKDAIEGKRVSYKVIK
ncbi:MAG: Holliday junction resolvase-like protein [Candidatus Aenigmatarchaeota archaeon]